MNVACRSRWLIVSALMLMQWYTVAGQPLLPGISCFCEAGALQITWQSQFDGVRYVRVNRSFDSLGRFDQVGTLVSPVKGVQRYSDTDVREGKVFYRLSLEFNSGLVWNSNVCRKVVDSACISSVRKRGISITKDTANLEIRSKLSVISFSRILLPRPIDTFEEPTFVMPVHVGVQKNTGHVFVKLPKRQMSEKCSVVFCDRKGVVVLSIAELQSEFVLIERRNFQHQGLFKFLLRKGEYELESGYLSLTEANRLSN